MTPAGYETVTLGHAEWTVGDGGGEHVPLTERAGCTDTRVDAYRTAAGASIRLQGDREHLCVPLSGAGTLSGDESHAVEPVAVAFAPAGGSFALASEDEATWLVVSAAADGAPAADPVVLDVASLDFSVPETSDVPIARLTDRLGARGMKVNVRRLRPGDVVPYHTEGTQEELFVPLDGNGTVRVDGETYVAPRGSVTRVAPELPRSAVNPGEADVDWLMVGAPPTGAADEWDPGAEDHEWPGSG